MTSDSRIHVVAVAEEFGAVLSGRAAGAMLRQQVEGLAREELSVVLDFAGVEIATPGFADELFGKLSRGLVEQGSVQFAHLDDDLRVLHDLVVARRAGPG
jgi:hypothetical protein